MAFNYSSVPIGSKIVRTIGKRKGKVLTRIEQPEWGDYPGPWFTDGKRDYQDWDLPVDDGWEVKHG